MKLKSIVISGLLLLGVGAATTSCEDMFTAENQLVTTDLAPKDTLYQVMGILQRVQKLADRTVLLGEIRADLTEVDPIHASADIQELANNEVSTTNAYNKPGDYYAVINNCNIYLANVDSARYAQGTRRYFEKEVCAVKCFRAWCYLELCKIYGEVPFITEPILDSDKAEQIVSSGKKENMKTILDFCIQDLQKYPYMDENNELRQDYGNRTFAGFNFSKMFIPVRALLGELYLWRGSFTNSQSDYIDAIRMYHDYFIFKNEEIGVSRGMAKWRTRDFNNVNDEYKGATESGDIAALMPLDTTTYFGNVTDVRAVFNSQYSNSYYPAVVPSQRLKDISKAQDYCYYAYDGLSKDTLYGVHDGNAYEEKIQEGDLRLFANYKTLSNFQQSQYNSELSPMQTFITKYTGGQERLGTDQRQAYIPYFRNTILYLHLAEALNRAGFPETAYAILTRGLSYYTMTDRDLISQDEYDRLCEIKSYGFTLQDPKYSGDELAKTTGTFVIWPSTVYGYYDKATSVNGNYQPQGGNIIQIGVHSRGCGDTEYNKRYYLDDAATLAGIKSLINPTEPLAPRYDKKTDDADSTLYKAALAEYQVAYGLYEDSLAMDEATVEQNVKYLASPEVRTVRQARVKQLILDEECLEGMFEGYRFYDLLRYQMQEGKVSGSQARVELPAYLTEKYGAFAKDNMTGKPWYITLPQR